MLAALAAPVEALVDSQPFGTASKAAGQRGNVLELLQAIAAASGEARCGPLKIAAARWSRDVAGERVTDDAGRTGAGAETGLQAADPIGGWADGTRRCAGRRGRWSPSQA